MKTKKTAIALALLLALTLLTGCGSKSVDTAAEEPEYEYSYDAAYDYDFYAAEEELAYEYAEPASPAEEAAWDNGVAASGQQSAYDASAQSFSDKIIYTCYAQIETQDFDTALEGVYALIEQYGGFLESSTVGGADYRGDGLRYADFTIRIPRDSFQTVTSSLSALGNVPYCSTNAENITSGYVDTESRLSAYTTEETRLLALLEQAQTVEDMLDIEDRLANVRYEIESLTTTLRGWDSLINYSTLNLELNEVEEYTESPEPTYWESLGNTLRRSIRGIGNFFKGFFRVLVALVPVIVLLGAAAAVVLPIILHARKKRTAKKAETTEEKTE